MGLTQPWDSPLLYALLLVPFLIWGAVRRWPRREYVWREALIAYLIFLAGVTLTPLALTPDARFPPPVPLTSYVNLMPSASILGAFRQSWVLGAGLVLKNLLLLVPFGYLLPRAHRWFDRWSRVLGAALVLAVGIESAQFLLLASGLLFEKAIDIDNVILDVVGAAIGYAVFVLAERRFTSGRQDCSVH